MSFDKAAYAREYRQKNKDKIKAYMAAYRQRKGDAMKAYQSQYYQDHKDKSRQRYLDNREQILAAKKLRPVAPRGPRRDEGDRHFVATYGITRAEADALIDRAGGCCEICGKPSSESRWGRLVIDHCHVHGHIRGALCNMCNVAIGLLGDSPATIRKAAHYLESRAARQTA